MYDNRVKICICGGGSQGHISAGIIGRVEKVNILTRKPNLWSNSFITEDLDGRQYCATLNKISSNPQDVIPESDIVLICLPGFAIKETLEKIKPYLTENTVIGSVFGGSGFFLQVFHILGRSTKCFAFQRVPFTGRIKDYGKTAKLKGYKPYLKIAFNEIDEEQQDKIISRLNIWYGTKIYKLKHFLEATLSNSNPLLHPCRLYILFKDWTPEKIYNKIPFLYDTDWDDQSSNLWVECDKELRDVLKSYPVNLKEIPSVLEYYECKNIKELTKKIRSIVPFKGVKPHMVPTKDGYKLDSTHRYFQEDIPYGLLMIKLFAEFHNILTPNIDKVLDWAQKIMNKKYIVSGKLDYSSLPFKISEINEL